MNEEIKLPVLKCLRCGHEWTPRGAVVTVCPKCKSPYWRLPRKDKGVAVEEKGAI